METVLLAGYEANQFKAATHKIAKLADVNRRHKAAIVAAPSIPSVGWYIKKQMD